MASNRQADSLVTYNNYAIYSKDINFSKKNLKKLQVGSWLKIEQDSLDIVIIKDKKVKYRATLLSNGKYFYIQIENSDDKKFKITKNDNSFNLKYSFSTNIFNGTLAIAKSPLSVEIIYNKKEYAKAKLYMSDSIYLQIKEIL